MTTTGAAGTAFVVDNLDPAAAVDLSPSITSSRPEKKGGWITFPFIAGSLVGMSIAQSGVASNLIVYLIRRFHVKSIDAAQNVNIFNACTFAAPVVGAVLADSWLGCFPVVLVSTFFSLLGMILFTLSAAVASLRPSPCSNPGPGSCESASSAQYAVLFAAVSFIGVGAGGTRFNTATMGADQFDRLQDQGVFFNWFFCFMYASAFIGATIIVYVQDNVGWGLGFSLCAVCNALSLLSLLMGIKYYRHRQRNGSPFTDIARVVVAAVRKARVAVSSEDARYYYGPSKGKEPIPRFPSETFRFLNKAAVVSEGTNETHPDGSVARPWRLCTVAQVEDLKDIVRILPLWSTAIFLSVSVGIQQSLTIVQALTVDRSIGPHFALPAGSLSVASLAIGAVILPFLDRVVYPLSSRFLGSIPTPLQRIGLGHLANAVGIAISALVERHRLDAFQSRGLRGPGGTVPVSVAWLVLPLALVGLGEALHFPGQVELYYAEFPEGLRTTGTAMIALIVSLGFYLATALIGLFRRATSWIPDDINNGRMDLLYWTLVAVCLVNFGLFFVCAKRYTYRSDREPENLDDHEAHRAPGY